MKFKWFIEYYKVHYREACKDTYKFFKKHILIKALFIIAIPIAGIFIGNKMFEPVNLTMNILTGLAGLGVLVMGVFFWNLLFYTRIRIFGSNLETIKSLKEQQIPKLLIRFNENEHGYIYDECGDYGGNIGRQICERTIRIRVDNISKSKAIEGVEVMLTDIDKCTPEQKGRLPLHLKLRNDNKNQDSFTIPINGYKFFEVICAYRTDPSRPIREFKICHIEQKKYTEIPLYFRLDADDYKKIKIEVKSNTAICEPKYLMVGLRDNLIEMWSIE